MEHKQVPVSAVRGVDSADGIVEAIVSVTNIVDSVNDVIVPGAYAKTLKKRNPKGVWSHDTNIPVAKTLSVVELIPGDTRLPRDLQERSAGALLVKMQFNLNTTRGRDAFHDVQFFGTEQEWSIGYSVSEGKSRVEEKSGIRYINELELYEYSPVIFGAAPHTRTLSLKEDEMGFEEKANAGEVGPGTFVSFAVPKPPDETEFARGTVDRVVRSGEITLPGQSETLTASSQNPVAVITVYARTEDGSYKKTDRKVIKNFSNLRVVKDFIEDEKSFDEIEIKAEKYDDLDFSIPSGVKRQAEIGIRWSKEYNRGGTEVGKATASYLANNSSAGPEKTRHIARYFPRHAVDLKTPANSNPGAKGYPGAGLIAWKLWGGDEGQRWSSKLVEAMNRRDEEAKDYGVEEKASGVSASAEKTLRQKVKDHNEKYGKIAGKRATFSMLAACYRRGIGAYRGNPSSVRPTVTSAEQWAMARVNGLLFALRTGGFRRVPYDTDLLPSEHSLSSRGKDEGNYSSDEIMPDPSEKTKVFEEEKELVPHRDEMIEGLAEQEQMGLSPRQFSMYDLYEKIADEFGMWDQSSTADGAHYFTSEKNPFTEEGIYCGNCVFYKGGQACHIVDGQIEPMGLCKLWIIKEEILKEPKSTEKQAEIEDTKDSGPNGKSVPSHKTAVDLNRAWDKTQPYKNMRSPQDGSYYAKIFAFQNPNTTGDRKTHYNFIHHYVSADGTPGAASYSAMINSMTVLNGGRSGTVLRGEARKSVYRHIASHYEDAGKPVPELKGDDFVDYVMMMKNIIDKPLTPVEGIEVKAVGRPIGSHTTTVSDRKRPLTRQNAILKVNSPASKAYFGKIFAYQLENTAGDMKTHYTFIHHFVDDDGVPGAAAMSELSVQMSVLNGARSGTKLRGEDRKSVWNHLAHHYRDFGKKPPELKSDQYIDNIMMQKGIIAQPISDMETTNE